MNESLNGVICGALCAASAILGRDTSVLIGALVAFAACSVARFA